jgi:AraC family transcriptional regulator
MIKSIEIKLIKAKKLIGKRCTTNLNENNFTFWQSFMLNKKKIKNATNLNIFSVEIYPAGYFENFISTNPFEKWAAVEVEEVDVKQAEFEVLNIPEGLYAVFVYKGKSSAAFSAFKYIFETYLPQSNYILDNRPHFEVMGEAYRHNDENSEEEIFVPIKMKA